MQGDPSLHVPFSPLSFCKLLTLSCLSRLIHGVIIHSAATCLLRNRYVDALGEQHRIFVLRQAMSGVGQFSQRCKA